MLTSISCDLFREGNLQRPSIVFNQGLNIILGNEYGTAGSIGKSTMMLIIDFCFGGDAYSKSDAVSQLGNHTIYFTFNFAGEDYHFARLTSAKEVLLLPEGSIETQNIPLKSFREWLCEQYRMDLVDVTFRSAIGRFFRIYGKNNFNEHKPLQNADREKVEDAINVLLDLFNEQDELIKYRATLLETEKKYDTFKNARRYNFVSSDVSNKKKYKENNEEIEELTYTVEQMKSINGQTFSREDLDLSVKRNDIIGLINDTKRQLNDKQNELRLLEFNMSSQSAPTEADLQSLLVYFPNTNLEILTKIEAFHDKIRIILHNEFETAISDVNAKIESLNSQIQDLTKNLEEFKPSQLFSDEFLDAYSHISKRIEELQNANQMYLDMMQFKDDKKAAQEEYNNRVESSLKSIEACINKELEQRSDRVTKNKYMPPHLDIPSFKKYTFETINDKGTNANYRSLILLDLSILNKTCLPAVVHDSILFDSISRTDLSQLLKEYNSFNNKQIFIALDKTDHCTEEAKAIIAEKTVLKLDDGKQALFGIKWGEKRQG